MPEKHSSDKGSAPAAKIQAEIALQESEEKYRFLVEMTGTGYVIIDGGGRVLDANDEYVRLTGHARLADILGRSVVEWTAEHDRTRNAEEVKKCFETGSVRNLEVAYVGRDGRITPIELSATVMGSGPEARIFTICKDITERKRAEEELAERGTFVKQIMDTASVGIGVVDRSGRFTHASRRMADLFGFRVEEFIGSSYLDRVHPSERSEAQRSMLALLSGEVPIAELDRRYQRKDGTAFWGHLTCNRFFDSRGNHVGLIGAIMDITERKLAEEELKRSEARLRKAQELAKLGNWMLDIPDNRLWWSDELYRIFGFSPDEGSVTLERFLARVHPDDRDELRAQIASGQPFRSDYRISLPDGTLRYIHEEVEIRRNSGGASVSYAGTAQDITERKLAEERVLQGERFIRSILDTVDEGFLVIDRDFRILTANKAYCSQLSRSCDEVIGRNCYAISHRTNRPCYEQGEECAVRAVFADGEPHTALHKHTGADGQVLYVETKAYPIRDAAGTVISVIETINNITEKHLLEEERLKTQKLESIGTLAGGIAHDFNNLLQGVFGYISMAKLTFDQKERSLAMLEQAEKALHLSVNLTSQLLTFSKGGKPVRKRIALAPVIENAAKFALSGSRSDFRLDIAPDLWHADADGGQLGQVIQNIVLNADQAMPLGGSVLITARNLTGTDPGLPQGLPERDHVVISVQDSGVGIPEQYLNRIFDPYFTTKEKGSGLGLATSYSIVKNHDGRITVTSERGRGSTFSLYLPAAGAKAAQPQAAAAAAGTRKGRILVMDDEDVVRMVAGELIRTLGHEAAFARDGSEAVQAFREAKTAGRPFDVVILDLTIRGGMGGEDAVKQLREIDPGVKAVVSSGYSDDAVTAGFRERGFNAFLKKPYDVDGLERLLDSLMV